MILPFGVLLTKPFLIKYGSILFSIVSIAMPVREDMVLRPSGFPLF